MIEPQLDIRSDAVDDHLWIRTDDPAGRGPFHRQRISESLHKLDPTLVEAARRAANKMRYQVGRLEKRAAQAELRKEDILTRQAAQIENALYPRRTLQEREIAGIYFLARFGTGLIDRLIETASARCPEHKIVRLG